MDIQCNNCQSYLNIRELVEKCLECKELIFNLKTQKMNPFKEKDTVYHYKYGEGKVIEVTQDTVLIKYENKSHWHSELTLLSFTPYKLEGFTQERLFEPEVGKMYFFWDEKDLKCKYVVYGLFTGKMNINLYGCSDDLFYEHISETNPLL